VGDSDAGKNPLIRGSIGADGRDGTTQPRPCRTGCGRAAQQIKRRAQGYCKTCYAAYTAASANRRYQENYRLARDLLGGVCIDCGEPDRPEKKLRFSPYVDHPSGDLRPVGRFMMHCEAILLDRVKWCDLVCHSCHTRRHYKGVPNTDAHWSRREKTKILIDFLTGSVWDDHTVD
jgi:hypothetical protein